MKIFKKPVSNLKYYVMKKDGNFVGSKARTLRYKRVISKNLNAAIDKIFKIWHGKNIFDLALYISAVFVVLMVVACSPKVEKKMTGTAEVKRDTVKKEVKTGPRPTPCTMFSDLDNGEDIKGEFVIYKNFLKTNEWDEAYEYWTHAVHSAPGSNGRVKYHFDDGVKIFKHFFDNEKDSLKKAAWVDSINWVYNKRLECFGDEPYVAGRKAFDFYYYFSDYVNEDTIFNLFAKAADGKKEKSDYFIINPFSKLLYDRYKAGTIDTNSLKHYANILVEAIDYGSTHCKGQECQAWEMIKSYAPDILDNFEVIKGFYPCEYYRKRYLPLFKGQDTSCDTVNMVYRKLKWGQCDMNDPGLADLIKVKNTKCYVAPPAPGPLRQAFNYYNEGKYKEAIKSFEEFVNKTDDPEKKAKYLYLISKIYYTDLKNFPLARKYALKAAKYKKNWGKPYILIGKLYASSGPICGPGRGWDSQIVTWPAIDKFQYAKKIDPSVAKEANKLIRQYKKFMPSKEDIFFRTLKEGQKFKVGCWINETTTIRTVK